MKLYISKKEKEKIYLDKNGVLEDKFYNTDTNRSVLISSSYSYDLVKNNDIDMRHGSLGENILMDYNPYSLKQGTKLKIGTSILEITQNCTICNHLSKIDKKVPKLLKNDRGIFAKVIKDGYIKNNDIVKLIS